MGKYFQASIGSASLMLLVAVEWASGAPETVLAQTSEAEVRQFLTDFTIALGRVLNLAERTIS
jgi:hypothetical protein